MFIRIVKSVFLDFVMFSSIFGSWLTNEGPSIDRSILNTGTHDGVYQLPLTPNWTAEINIVEAQFGWSVASAGDVNGDGFDDVIIGAAYYGNGQVNEGAVYAYYGSGEGLSTEYNWRKEINQDNAKFGWSVSSAGDVNGDGFSDILVGAPYYANGNSQEGAAFVYLGSEQGLLEDHAWSIEGNVDNALLGKSVASAGDINGDGFGDIIIGKNINDSYIYFGSNLGLSSTPVIIPKQGYVDNVGDINGDGFSDVIVGGGDSAKVYLGSSTGELTASWEMEGPDQGGFGDSAGAAGDVNADGYGDVIIGERGWRGISGFITGRAYIFLGSESGLSNTPAWTTQGVYPSANGNYGVSVGSAGDINSDGFDDVIVGSSLFDNPQIDEGGVYVFLGGPTGVSATADWISESNQAYSQYGYSVSSAGDVNGDGASDILIGAMLYENLQLNEGRAFAFYGVETKFTFIPYLTK